MLEKIERDGPGSSRHAASSESPHKRLLIAKGAETEQAPWGEMRWLSRPELTGTEDLVAVQVTLQPGQGHDFHYHDGQAELIYVVSGQVEQ